MFLRAKTFPYTVFLVFSQTHFIFMLFETNFVFMLSALMLFGTSQSASACLVTEVKHSEAPQNHLPVP